MGQAGKKIHPVKLHSMNNPLVHIVTAVKDHGTNILLFPYYTYRLRSTYCICRVTLNPTFKQGLNILKLCICFFFLF